MSENDRVFRNRIVGHDDVAPDQLLANPQNWRRHSSAQQNTMEGVLDEVGWVQAVIVNVNTQHVIDGHMRIAIAMRNQEETVPVTYVKLTEEEERLILATYDPIGTLATRDAELLHGLLNNLPKINSESLQALLDAERSETTKLLSYDHTQNIIKGEASGRDSVRMMEDYLTTSVRQITLVMNPDTYREALTILRAMLKHYSMLTNAEPILMMLRDWAEEHPNELEAATEDTFAEEESLAVR